MSNLGYDLTLLLTRLFIFNLKEKILQKSVDFNKNKIKLLLFLHK